MSKFTKFITETLKFPFYSKQEVELQQTTDSSQSSLPQQAEHPHVVYDPFASYSTQYGQQQVWSSNKNVMISKWRDASYLPEVELAIEEISNEAIVFDEIEDVISINLSDIDIPDSIKEKINDSFDKIKYLLDFNENGDLLFKQWYIDGQLNIESVYDNVRTHDGIKKLILLSPYNLNKYIDPRTRETKFFYGEEFKNIKYSKAVFTEEQITHINSGLWSSDKKFPISFLNKAMKTINQLALIEDSLVIMRISKSTEKRVFYINTRNLPKSKAEEYIKSLISKYRQKRVYNTETGQVENKNKTISVLEDFWFPVDGKGEGTKVENLPGIQSSFNSFEDVDYFVFKMYKALGVPTNRRAPDSRITFSNGVDLEKEELKFFKFILKLRRKFNNLFVDLLKKDLLSRKVLSLEDWTIIQEKIKFTYANSNEFSELKNNQILESRLNTANSANSLVESGYLSKPYVQKNILRLTDDEIKTIEEENAVESGDGSSEDDAFDDIQHNFGDDFSVRKRNPEPIKPNKDVDLDIEKEPETKPTSPEGGAAESKISYEKILQEHINNILNNINEGDILTNGTIKLKYTNGNFESVE